MTNPRLPQFNDGALYDQMMGKWSQLAGTVFLDWLAPRSQLRWIDIGCGSGAFTELIVERCAPAGVEAIDPSEAQLGFARGRASTAHVANFTRGDAMALSFADRSFDVATMALVIFFVPEPAKGVAEMMRVVRPGGMVAAYAWDFTRGGFPLNAVWDEYETATGKLRTSPPSAAASRMENLSALWSGAGLQEVETREIVVQRTFADFDTFWRISATTNVETALSELDPAVQELIKGRVAARLPRDGAGRISYTARANAIKGRRRA